MNDKPLAMLMAAIFAGYYGLLLIISGTLLTFTDQMDGSRGWWVFIGLVLMGIGAVFSVGTYGLWSRRAWGRRMMRLTFLICVPLNAVAVFPIFQNHRMTAGNTILQVAGLVFALLAAAYLSRKQTREGYHVELRSEDLPAPRDETLDEGAAFTFDRAGRADRL